MNGLLPFLESNISDKVLAFLSKGLFFSIAFYSKIVITVEKPGFNRLRPVQHSSVSLPTAHFIIHPNMADNMEVILLKIDSYVRLAVSHEGVGILEIDRPQKKNALSQAVIDDLIGAISDAEKDERVRCVVLTSSEGGPFSGTYGRTNRRNDVKVFTDGEHSWR